jgi:hypothetical protein
MYIVKDLEGSGHGLKVLAWNLHGGAKEKHEILSIASCPVDLILAPPKYESGVLPLCQPARFYSTYTFI